MFNCLIFGLPKSGTSGLFYAVKKLLSQCEKEKGFFEPSLDQLKKLKSISGPVVLKTLQGQLPATELDDLINGRMGVVFEKKISIIRDPRDNLISQMLYRTYDARFIDNQKKTKRWLDLLKDKEKNPTSVSVKFLMDQFADLDDGLSPGSETIINRFDQFVSLIEKYKKDFFLQKYEEFVSANTKQLSAFLGKDIYNDTSDSSIPKRILRTANYDNWRQWFTEEDTAFFQPRLDKFIEFFGYSNDWGLKIPETLDPQFGSKYVLKLVKERKKSIPHKIGRVLKKVFFD